MKQHPWRARILGKPTQKQMRAAFAAQAPLESTAAMPEKKKHRKGDDELPEWDGIGRTDQSKK